VLWEQLADRVTNPVVLVSGQIPDTANGFLLLLHKTGGVAGDLAIPFTLPVAERDKRLVAVRCGCALASGF
jgi:hypothetical protein